MKEYYIKGLILVIFLFSNSLTFGQESTEISIIKKYIAKVTDYSEEFKEINLDGSINSKHRKFLLFGPKNVKGGFAESYLVNDTNIISVFIGTRKFLNSRKTISTNYVEELYFLNQQLCYYKATKTYEDYLGINYYKADDCKALLIHEIEAYLKENKTLKLTHTGFSSDAEATELINEIRNSHNHEKTFNRIKYFIN
ncbi:hypothetical protein KDU71_10695 [Carboxylicivirga sediminis]|uniref:Uncharacterized protein n=1 Tax=Carboxylicivirga sediminis TaxID=2006564 RepID=A0A941F431_9BACT|nr:hypothetical protein [Carboxylicivirga sediminis]MBR8536027.1 hypothetical protein [Carboxylicivirga sediminis]